MRLLLSGEDGVELMSPSSDRPSLAASSFSEGAETSMPRSSSESCASKSLLFCKADSVRSRELDGRALELTASDGSAGMACATCSFGRRAV